jgi:hypothetical protein
VFEVIRGSYRLMRETKEEFGDPELLDNAYALAMP